MWESGDDVLLGLDFGFQIPKLQDWIHDLKRHTKGTAGSVV